ncbi:MAG: NAD(P)/FAD-dependent oxidoreductase [Planctomycetes bacterium]|nr:NAD(P)/FAD-dependent oxidoreductase [Planctomycetota bacterium]
MRDVVVLGSGLGGSTLAAVLARQGLDVLVLEAGSHPRFAVGESVVPEFGARARILAKLYGVDELAYLSNFQWLRHRVSGSSGVKRNFTFLTHEAGEEHRAAATSQFEAMTYPLGPDTHLYRPEVDTWLNSLAVRYGAEYRERVEVRGIEFAGDRVTLQTSRGTEQAKFVVDATGFRSVLAEREGLRPAELPHQTDTRSIFTHMVGVGGLVPSRRGDPLPVPSPPDQGTLHHLFHGGWFWVIPFDNHLAATNPLCSVGVTLDRRVHPDDGRDGEVEFREIVGRFPTVARQLERARAVRGFVKTGRVQYASTRVAGDRWCLLPHAAFFVDALFSAGNTLTLAGIQEVTRVLLQAFAEDRFTATAFADYQQGIHDNLQLLDRVVHGAYLCMGSAELFNAYFRVWAVCNFHASAAAVRAHLRFAATGDRGFLEATHDHPFRRVLGLQQPRLRELVDAAYAIVLERHRGALREEAAVDRLFELLRQQSWIPPQFHIAERKRRHLASFTAFPLTALILWGKRHAPPEIRAACYDVGPVFYWELTKSLAREAGRSAAQFGRVVMNAHFTRGRA